ncbi:MAG: thymidine phosphorylase, partial [Pseudonocardiales bacterium]|nr:thymidine phosphorylase [Pseudonocardiales bacterium]
AGRARKEDPVQAAAGVRLLVGLGETVVAGQPLAELHTDTPEKLPAGREALERAMVVADEAAERPALVIDTVRPE